MKLKLWVKIIVSIILLIFDILILASLSGNGTNGDLLKIILVEVNTLLGYTLIKDGE